MKELEEERLAFIQMNNALNDGTGNGKYDSL